MKRVVVSLACLFAILLGVSADSIVVFNEIMYHPAVNEASMEWVELHNQNGVDVDIGGWTLSGGVSYVFPPGTRIRGKGYLVVASNPAALAAAGGASGALGPFAGRLGNSSDKLQLRDRNDRVMDSVSYSSGGSWPAGADGSGASLAKRDPALGSGSAENWTVSDQAGGTPGARNFPGPRFEPPAGLVSFWNFDESSGDVLDLAGPNPGVLGAAATRRPGLVGPGAVGVSALSGSAVLLGRGNGGSLSVTQGLTLEAVISPTWDGVTRSTLFRREQDNHPNLVSYWSFDEASTGTTVAQDIVGGNNGIFRGTATRTNGIYGKGGLFFRNSTSDGLNVGTGISNSFSFTNGITIAAWVVPQWSGASNTYDAIFFKDDGANRISFGFQYDSSNSLAMISLPPGPVLSFGLNIGGLFGEFDMPLDGAAGRPSLATLTNGRPHHLAATFDAVSGSLGIWVDGMRAWGTTRMGPIKSGGTAPAFIGNRGTAGGQPFTGVIDEVAIWSAALTPSQIDGLSMGGGAPEVTPNTTPGNRVQFGFRRSGDTEFTDPAVLPIPTLFFGMKAGGVYSELEARLDGVAGRPKLSALQNGKPHHVAALCDPAAGRKAILIDGVVVASEAVSGPVDTGGIGLAFLGNSSPILSNEAFQGTFDEMAYWGRALTDSEVATHARRALAGRSYFAPLRDDLPTISFSELASTAVTPYWIEIANHGAAPVNLQGITLARSGGGVAYAFPGTLLAAGSFLVVSQSQLGWRPKAGELLTLTTPDRSAVIDTARVTTGAQARLQPGFGPWYVPSASTAGSANQVELHDQVVINEILYHAPPVFSETVQYTNSLLVPIDATWKYNQSGADLGTAWRAPGFDDSAWASGPALFYNETATLPAAKNTPLTLGPITYYFRKTLSFAEDPAGVSLILRPVVDDGAVVYLNGVEILRYNLKAGPMAVTNLATTVNNAVFSGPFTVFPTNLVQGDNLLAVEVHQSAANSDDVVFGLEITQHRRPKMVVPYSVNPEQWVELYNRSAAPVDLTGWRFSAGVDYGFPGGTTLPAGGYLVVAADPVSLQAKYPGIAILGPWSGHLGTADHLVLTDAAGNPADDVHYQNGGRWPEEADARGSSLELRDPNSDNSRGEAWGGSEELSHSAWTTIDYAGTGAQLFTTPSDAQYNELVIGLLDTGEVLIDDVVVRDLTVDPSASIIQNSDFESGLDRWRVVGNHHAEWILDPDNPNNHVMRLVATGMTEHMSNHAETTFKSGGKFVTLSDTHQYRITLRARWVSGSPQLNTRLYFNRMPRTTILPMTSLWGTPGAPNSRAVSNWGPTYSDFGHFPVVPAPGQPVTVSVSASDPQSVASCTLHWSTNSGSWSDVPMTRSSGTAWAGGIPGLASGTVVQFYVSGVDGLGAVSTMPADGPDSRALYQVADGQADLSLSHNFRLVMTRSETNLLLTRTNLMSNGRIGCTVILDEQEAVYDCGVRLKGSEHGRPQPVRIGFNVDFPPEHLFRGVHSTVAIDRSGGGNRYGQDEILINHVVDHAGGVPAQHNDLLRLVGPTPYFTGSSILQMSRYGPVFLGSQFPNGADHPVFEVEYYYGQSEQIPTGPEGYKVPQEADVTGSQMQDNGDDKENYRLGFIIKNARDKDDFESLMPNLQMFSMTDPAAFVAAAEQRLDVEEWLRCFALGQLCGAGDNYTGSGAGHNVMVYVRPDNGRFIQLIWDMDFAFTQGATDSLENNNDLSRLLTKPALKHSYYSHIREILETTYNTNYMAYWVDHYDNYTPGQDFSGFLTYIRDRSNYARTALPKQVPFAVTSNGGRPFVTNSAIALVAGSAWVDAKDVTFTGSTSPSDLTWSTWTNWVARVPLLLGSNVVYFSGYRLDGSYLTNTSTTIVSSALTGAPDSDGDGIPDAWENIYDFNPLVADSNGDADHDGFTNLEEYLAGTDPRDPASRLSLDGVVRDGDGVRILFTAITGRSYAIQYREDVAGSSWQTLSAFSPGLADAQQSALDSAPPGSHRFYRLVTPAP